MPVLMLLPAALAGQTTRLVNIMSIIVVATVLKIVKSSLFLATMMVLPIIIFSIYSR